MVISAAVFGATLVDAVPARGRRSGGVARARCAARGSSAPTPAAWSWSTSSWASAPSTADGHEQWTTPVDGILPGAPALDREVVLVGGETGVTALARRDGAVQWRRPMGDLTYAVAVAGDVALAGDRAGTLTAFDVATGDVRWSVHFSGVALVGAASSTARAARWSRRGTRPASPRCASSTSRPVRCAGRRRSARARPRPRSTPDSSCSRSATATGTRGSRRATWPPACGAGRRGAGVVRGGHRARGRRSGASRWSTTSAWSPCSTSPPGGASWQHDLARALLQTRDDPHRRTRGRSAPTPVRSSSSPDAAAGWSPASTSPGSAATRSRCSGRRGGARPGCSRPSAADAWRVELRRHPVGATTPEGPEARPLHCCRPELRLGITHARHPRSSGSSGAPAGGGTTEEQLVRASWPSAARRARVTA